MSDDPPIPFSASDRERRARASELLEEFLAHDHGARVSVGDLIRVLGDRAFGALVLILAIPNVLPVPGLSTVTGLPIVLIAGQMVFGRHRPWLPHRLAAASMERDGFLRVLRRAHRYMAWIERRLLRERLTALTSPAAERFVGVVMVVLAVVLALPIVFGNQPPALALSLLSLGLIERDGVFIVAGLVVAVVALAIVAAVVFGFAQGLLMLVGLAVS